jgi:hypothetical protein
MSPDAMTATIIQDMKEEVEVRYSSLYNEKIINR